LETSVILADFAVTDGQKQVYARNTTLHITRVGQNHTATLTEKAPYIRCIDTVLANPTLHINVVVHTDPLVRG